MKEKAGDGWFDQSLICNYENIEQETQTHL